MDKRYYIFDQFNYGVTRWRLKMLNTNPFVGLIKTVFLYITGRVKFIKKDVGMEYTMDNNDKYTVFRHVIIKPFSKRISEPKAIFRIRFQLCDMGIEENKKFSRIPMLVFMGFKGFRSKLWMVNEKTNFFQGIYEWQTMQDAEAYSKSIAMKFMTKRSVEGSISYEIIEKS